MERLAATKIKLYWDTNWEDWYIEVHHEDGLLSHSQFVFFPIDTRKYQLTDKDALVAKITTLWPKAEIIHG